MIYLDIDKTQIPCTLQVMLPTRERSLNRVRLYDLEIRYNLQHDFFVIDIKRNDETLVFGQKLVLNKSVYADYSDMRLPLVDIVPRNRPGQKGDVTFENWGDTVLLAVEGEGLAYVMET